MTKVFNETGTFAAVHAAEQWCAENGIAVGTMQGPSPRGLMYGDWDISKWRNMSKQEQAQCHGTMTGDMRHGPVVVEIDESKRGEPVPA